jgi:hypothetical protein
VKRNSSRAAGVRAAPGLLLLSLLLTTGGCISGRVLTGYPGYPFARFDTSLASDSTFFRLQPALESEGFPLDFTILDEGLITTRSSELLGRPVFLNLVVEPREPDEAAESTGAESRGTRVWVAAYEETISGAERINPLQEEAWAAVMDVTTRLSAAVDGSTPVGPESRPDGATGDSAAGGP